MVTNLYIINWLFRNHCIMKVAALSKILIQQAKEAPDLRTFLAELKYRVSRKADSELEYKPIKAKYQFRMTKKQ